MSEAAPETQAHAELPVPVVGIGASAGGLEAILSFLAALPADTGLAYLFVTHLAPTHESLLAGILTSKTALTVGDAADGTALEPDHLYIMPPGKVMSLKGNRIRLSQRDSAPLQLPINTLFASLANERGDGAVAVVLSGSGTDGTEGVKAVKEAGGIVFAQEPDSAESRSMPESAVQTGCVDMTLVPGEIAKQIAGLSARPYLKRMPGSGSGPVPLEYPKAALSGVFDHLLREFRVDFNQYKTSTTERRVRRRMALRNMKSLPEYIQLLEKDHAEAEALFDDLLIKVTTFFRDPAAYEGLLDIVLPAACTSRADGDTLRIWVPGCASGEEVYSIAMVVQDYLAEKGLRLSMQIFGTDLSESAVLKARTGRYPYSIAERMSTERLQRFFTREDGGYRVNKQLRDVCVFARHDITCDPPYSRLDLVSCCNLLIYLGAGIQKQVMRAFHYSLKPGGHLIIGPAENVGEASPYFEPVEGNLRLFRRRALRAPEGPLITNRAVSRPSDKGAAAPVAYGMTDIAAVQRFADGILLSRFELASLLVDDNQFVIQFRGETSPYIEPASGSASLNLKRIVRPGLLVQLLPAIEEVRVTGRVAYRRNIRVESLDACRNVGFEVIPIAGETGRGRFFLIIFDSPVMHRGAGASSQALSGTELGERVLQLERELAETRQYMQATSEVHETSSQQAVLAQEELQSANEEFQSTNEELETAKEELQSANEELTSANEELQHRAKELGEANGQLTLLRDNAEYGRVYANAIIDSMSHPMLVLREDLHVARVNRAFYDIFDAVPATIIDRSVFELGPGWDGEEMREAIENVARGEVSDEASRLIQWKKDGVRVRSLLVRGRKIPGSGARAGKLLFAIDDVTDNEQKLEAVITASDRKDEFLAMLAHELRNPIAPISNALHILKAVSHDAALTPHFDMMGRQVRIMTRLVEDLMDVSRISRGQIKVNSADADLTVLVSSAVAAAKSTVEKLGHRISVHLPPYPVRARVDSVRMEQVINNLLNNACKYTDPGGRISVSLAVQDSQAVISVCDSGIGMAPGLLPHVFDMFVQGDWELARSQGGLGIGLTLVRRIVELHGGSVAARSPGLGKGSEFEVRIPLAEQALASNRAALLSPIRVPGTDAPPQACKVLIVDDNVDSVHSLVQLVRMWGHQTAQAYDGKSALEIAQAFKPDVAVLDLGLPAIDGFELAVALRHLPETRATYLIAMTGYGDEKNRARAKKTGFDDYLLKPVELATLRGKLNRPPSHVN